MTGRIRSFVCAGCVRQGLAKNLIDSKFFATGDADIDEGRKNPDAETKCPYCHTVGFVKVVKEV